MEERIIKKLLKLFMNSGWNFFLATRKTPQLPQILLMENVPDVIGINNVKDFNKWQWFLESLGYKNYINLLNARDFEIPQNRNRCFIVSLLGEYSYNFPSVKKLQLRLKDLLEDNIDEKYYLSENQLKNIMFNKAFTKDKDLKVFAELNIKGNESIRRIYDPKYISPTLTTMQGGNRQPKIIQRPRGYNKGGEHELCSSISKCTGNDIGVVVGYNPYNDKQIGDIAPAQTTGCGSTTSSSTALLNEGLKIRKLTPKECWRLMGFDDEDFEKAAKVNSNTQLYKQAGNSIVVNVLEGIFKELL